MSLFTPGMILLKKYRVQDLVGSGSFAEVYLVTEIATGHEFAAKTFFPVHTSNPKEQADFERRIQNEQTLTRGLNHPNVVQTFEDGKEGDVIVIIMEYARRGNLEERLKHGPLSVQDSLQLIVQICDGISAVQRKERSSHPKDSLVHRDIKPQNILMDIQGVAKIGDWGLAQTGTESRRSDLGSLAGSHPGTPPYKSPEHFNGAYLRPSADVYALGCVLYEALIGDRYKNQKRGAVPSQRNPDIPRWIDAIVKKATNEDPDERYSNSAEMASAIRKAQIRAELTTRRIKRGLVTVMSLLIMTVLIYGIYLSTNSVNVSNGAKETETESNPQKTNIPTRLPIFTLVSTESFPTSTETIQAFVVPTILPTDTKPPATPAIQPSNTLQPTVPLVNTSIPATKTPKIPTNTPKPTDAPTKTPLTPTNTPNLPPTIGPTPTLP